MGSHSHRGHDWPLRLLCSWLVGSSGGRGALRGRTGHCFCLPSAVWRPAHSRCLSNAWRSKAGAPLWRRPRALSAALAPAVGRLCGRVHLIPLSPGSESQAHLHLLEVMRPDQMPPGHCGPSDRPAGRVALTASPSSGCAHLFPKHTQAMTDVPEACAEQREVWLLPGL